MSTTILDRPTMTAPEVARQLQMPAQTLWRWLDGYQAYGRTYEPILRPVPTGNQTMTWGEIVEARYLLAYRQVEKVPLQRLRPLIVRMREEFGIPYPLAHFKPFVDERRRLLLELEEQADVPGQLRMVYEVDDNQLVLSPVLRDFLSRVDFDTQGDTSALRIHPRGRKSPVVIDPLIKSGAATVDGIRTEALAEQASVGSSIPEIASDFDLSVTEVQAALAHEWGVEAA